MTQQATTEERLARLLERKGDDLENENYHNDAALIRDLAEAVRSKKFSDTFEDYQSYIDGEAVICWLARQTWQ